MGFRREPTLPPPPPVPTPFTCTKMADDLDRQFEAAQRELAAIKSRYASGQEGLSAVRTNAQPVRAPHIAPTAVPVAISSVQKANPEATKRLEVAENVMLKLYKRNMELENKVRELSADLSKAEKSQHASNVDENRRTAGNYFSINSSSEARGSDSDRKGAQQSTQESSEFDSANHAPHQPNALSLSPSPTSGAVENKPELSDNAKSYEIARLKRELDNLRVNCARFAAKNRVAREDFNKLAKVKVDSLASADSVGQTSQHLLKVLMHRLETIERERDADAKAYTERLEEAEAAGREIYMNFNS